MANEPQRPEQPSPESDDAARLTPYEVVFGASVFEEEKFPGIREEAGERGVDPAESERFLMLGSVGRLLGRMLPEDAPGQTIEQYGRLLFQAFNFWRFDRQLFVLESAPARRLTERPPRIGEWEIVPPHPAGYLQLPRHLFWARTEEEANPEPVDGIFWTMVGEEDPMVPPFRRLDLVVAMGLRPDRPGLSVIDIGEDLTGGPGHWGDGDARPDGRDFGNILPGGELEALHAFVTPSEVLKLTSLVFWHAAEHPEAVGDAEPPAEEAAPPSGHALPPSRLPHRRIRDVEEHG